MVYFPPSSIYLPTLETISPLVCNTSLVPCFIWGPNLLYWITPVRHKAADADSAPMLLGMPCLVSRQGGCSYHSAAMNLESWELTECHIIFFNNLCPCPPHFEPDRCTNIPCKDF